MTPTTERIVKELRDEAAKLNNVADILEVGSQEAATAMRHVAQPTNNQLHGTIKRRKHWTQRPENKAKVLSIMKKAQKARAA